MAQLASNISDELLSCKVCFCKYSQPDKLPKVLRCPHTFCKPCLKQMTVKCVAPTLDQSTTISGSGDKVTCPVCREVTTLSTAGVEGLSNNLTVLTLMDIVAGASKKTASLDNTFNSPRESSSLMRNRLECPEENEGRCIKCSIKHPKYQFVCGHCICDNCLKCLLRESEDECPQCQPSLCKIQCKTRLRRLQTPLSEALIIVTPPTQAAITETSSSLENQSSKRFSGRLNVGSPKKGAPPPPARPPPFNPTYITLRDGGVCSQPNQIRNQSQFGVASAIHDRSRLTDPDAVSLCSVASDSSLVRYQSPSPIVTLRRTQSMRRQAPPPPRRNNGTLLRRTLSPPPPPTRSYSAESLNTERGATRGWPRTRLSGGAGSLQGASVPLGVSPPAPPPRRIFKTQTESQTKCIKKFGTYSETMQTSCFRKPSRIALSKNGDILVTDTDSMIVQVFSLVGDYIAMFKVLGVQDACFLTLDKVCVACHVGVQIYSASGYKITDIPIGSTIAVVPYKFGFIAATVKSLYIFRQSLTLVKEINKYKLIPQKKWSPIHKKTRLEFYNILDIAVNPLKNIVVLDGGISCYVHILNEDGVCVGRIDSAMLSCGPLSNPEALATDFGSNVYISDAGNSRVLKFNSIGAFISCILSFRTHVPRGITVTDTDHLIVGLTGDHIAEIRVYNQG